MSDDLREAFEDAVYQQAFVSSIRVVQAQPGESRLLSDCPTKAEVCRRGEDGHYVVPTVDSAWWAWQQAHARGVAEERARVVAWLVKSADRTSDDKMGHVKIVLLNSAVVIEREEHEEGT